MVLATKHRYKLKNAQIIIELSIIIRKMEK